MRDDNADGEVRTNEGTTGTSFVLVGAQLTFENSGVHRSFGMINLIICARTPKH